MNLIGMSYGKLNKPWEASKYYDQVLAVRASLNCENLGSAQIMINRASILKKIHIYEKALELELIALEIIRKFFDDKSIQMLKVYNALADTYQFLKDN